MALYYVNNNAQSNGDHEVHKEGCSWMPSNKKTLVITHHASRPWQKPKRPMVLLMAAGIALHNVILLNITSPSESPVSGTLMLRAMHA
jgi:hypothetical protein